jgi:hypothetical protein
MRVHEVSIRVRTDKYLSHAFSVKNGLKRGDALFLLLINHALQFDIRKVQENQEGLEMNGVKRILVLMTEWEQKYHEGKGKIVPVL